VSGCCLDRKCDNLCHLEMWCRAVEKHIIHPVVGSLVFGIEALVSPHDAEQRLVVYTVEPGSQTARNLPVLASWGLDTLTTSADR
jgi:hypothetical protein